MIYVLCFNTKKHAVPIVESTDNPKNEVDNVTHG